MTGFPAVMKEFSIFKIQSTIDYKQNRLLYIAETFPSVLFVIYIQYQSFYYPYSNKLNLYRSDTKLILNALKLSSQLSHVSNPGRAIALTQE